MANKLVIVESPTKVRTPERILDNSYKTKSAWAISSWE